MCRGKGCECGAAIETSEGMCEEIASMNQGFSRVCHNMSVCYEDGLFIFHDSISMEDIYATKHLSEAQSYVQGFVTALTMLM